MNHVQTNVFPAAFKANTISLLLLCIEKRISKKTLRAPLKHSYSDKTSYQFLQIKLNKKLPKILWGFIGLLVYCHLLDTG